MTNTYLLWPDEWKVPMLIELQQFRCQLLVDAVPDNSLCFQVDIHGAHLLQEDACVFKYQKCSRLQKHAPKSAVPVSCPGTNRLHLA